MLTDLQNCAVIFAKITALCTFDTFLVDIAPHTILFTVPPKPSITPLPLEVAKKGHLILNPFF